MRQNLLLNFKNLRKAALIPFTLLLVTGATASIPDNTAFIPQRAEVPTFDELTATASLLKNGLSASETAENLYVANSWRQQKTQNDINQLKLEETKQNLEFAKLQNELATLKLATQRMAERAEVPLERKSPTDGIKLTSIFANQAGQLKAVLHANEGKVTVQPGQTLGDLTVINIGNQHITLLNEGREYSLYLK